MQALRYIFVFGTAFITSGPDPDLEILLEVNLNFQVRLTVILAFGIFPPREHLGEFSFEI